MMMNRMVNLLIKTIEYGLVGFMATYILGKIRQIGRRNKGLYGYKGFGGITGFVGVGVPPSILLKKVIKVEPEQHNDNWGVYFEAGGLMNTVSDFKRHTHHKSV